MISESRKRANEKYNAKAYDNVLIRLKKGKKEEIQKFTTSINKSFNGFVNEAIDEKMDREKDDTGEGSNKDI